MMLREELFRLQDPAYRDFLAKLIPNIAPEKIIGVRTPELRRLSKALTHSVEAEAFLRNLPHALFEENQLHALLLSGGADVADTLAAVDAFLPHVDNWATCDQLRPKVFARHRDELLPHIRRWMESEHVYAIRFGLEMLMLHNLGDAFQPEYLAWAASVRHEDYYVRMMAAWFFATALTKQYDAALPYLEQHKLDPWVHRKAIQKARESLCIPDERKAYLALLR